MHSEKLILTKDSKLVEVFWDKENVEYVKREITHIPSAYHLHERPCEIEEGTTLKDIFIYMKKNIHFWDVILGNWCSDFIEEGLKPFEEEDKNQDTTTDYLELYWHGEHSTYKDQEELSGMTTMCFHGMGRYNEDCEYGYYKKDDEVALGISFTPVNKIASVEIKINTMMKIYEFCKTDPLLKGTVEPTLFQILYAIIWELSFHGPPAKRDEKAQELAEISQEITDNPDSAIPFEDFKKGLEEKFEDLLDDIDDEDKTIH